LFCMAIWAKIPLERMADPTDTSYIPRPEWYFLFLFQTLKVFEGPLEVVGTVILPTVAILALILTPFIDRSKLVKVRQRGLAIGIVLLAGLGWAGLTAAAIKSTPPQTEASSIDFAGPIEWMQLAAPEMAGIHYFKEANCTSCHNVNGGTPKAGPNLAGAGRRHDQGWLLTHFKQPSSTSPGSTMAPVNLTDPQLNDLAALMLKLNADNATVVDTAPEFAMKGAVLYQSKNCGACHKLNGLGGVIGPPLNGLSKRKTEAWVAEHFQNPQKMSPKTPMPPYPFTQTDMQNEVSYLFTLPDKAPNQ
jgi:mono/diheme cytochrome c family protein